MTDATAAAPKPAALWEDFVDVLTSPAAVFARRQAGRYGAGIAMLGVLAAVVFVATRALWQPFFDRQLEAGLAAQRAAGKLTPAQIEQGRAVVERIGNLTVWISGLFGTPLLVLLLALLVWGAARVFGARISYGQAATVAALAYVPRVLAFVVGAGILAAKDAATLAPNVLPTSPAALLGPDVSPYVAALLGRFDPFVLWGTVLIGIGVAVIGRVARGTGYAAAAVVWGVATLGALLGAARAVAAAGG